jgi:uncharacterized protein (DUF58 family)
MLPREMVRQIRRLQLRARRAVEDLLGGEYHSVFKGTGIAFEEVRAYQPGDDIRAIDWNVTARMGQPFVKRFIEERERTVLLALDCSGSQEFGTAGRPKREAAAELAAVLALSAISNNDRVGLVQFTDQIEQYLPPRKGSRHVLRLIRDVLFHEPARRGTSLHTGLEFVNRVLRRRAIVFLLSDFLDHDFEVPLKRAGRRHDLIAVRISDPYEAELPALGLVQFEDAETGRQFLLDTGSQTVRDAYRSLADSRRLAFRRLMAQANIDLVDVSTDGSHLDALVQFFRLRERRVRRR